MVHFIGNCLQCGYPLLRLKQNRCPECGREFDPADRTTMDFNRPRWAKFLQKSTTAITFIPPLMLWIVVLIVLLFVDDKKVGGLLCIPAVMLSGAAFYVAAVRRRLNRRLKKYARERIEAGGDQPGRKTSLKKFS